MTELHVPPNLEYVRTTDVFDESTHPNGLLRAHRVAEGVWAILSVHTGSLRFAFEDTGSTTELSAGASQVIPPNRLHHVEITGPVTFSLEFRRDPAQRTPDKGGESSGLTG